jgi:hypothetical protein
LNSSTAGAQNCLKNLAYNSSPRFRKNDRVVAVVTAHHRGFSTALIRNEAVVGESALRNSDRKQNIT